MSAQKRRSQQPHQQYHPHYPQQYAQDPGYTQFAGAPWQAAPSHQHLQQQLYYQPEQYPPPDPYAFASAAQLSASSGPYPQRIQYQHTPYLPQSQPYASPNTIGYHNAVPSPYSQGGYLAAEYAASGDLSPNYISPGSLSSGHSPKPSAGRSRLNDFVFPSQGTSPSLESQLAHFNIAASAASLPTKPTPLVAASPHPPGTPASRSNSGLVRSSQLRPHSTNTPIQNASTASDEPRSDISLRYPPLPPLPEPAATPSSLHLESSHTRVNQADDPSKSENESTLEQSVLDYVSSLRSIIDTYQQRDDLLRLRTEAVGFQPAQAWLAWQAQQVSNPSEQSSTQQTGPAEDADPANPILGVRLLQRLDKLQRENDELGRLVGSGARGGSASTGVEDLRKELDDCYCLIEAMDKALGNAEARASAAERALEVACRTNSTAMLPPKQTPAQPNTAATPSALPQTAGSDEGRKPPNQPKTASSTRRASKSTTASNTNGSSKINPQPRNRSHNPTKGEAKSNAGKARTRGEPVKPTPADGRASKGDPPT